MLLSLSLLSLPTSLLLLISASPWTTSAEADPQQPHNVAAGTPYHPYDEAHVKRALAAKELLSSKVPVGMRKMSDDPDEMFFLDYWEFDTGLFESNLDSDRGQLHMKRATSARYANESATDALLPPLRPHSLGGLREAQDALSFFRRNSLFSRDFKCPTGTNDCSSINAPDSCCATGETCITVQNTGNGVVGCCPAGDICGNRIGNCDTDAGYNNCPGSPNGGCCIPGYDCLGVGCISTSTTTTTTTLPVATAHICSSDSTSCASSFGGGCCGSGSTCGTSTCIGPGTSTTTATVSTTTASAFVPVRPTGTTTLSPSSSDNDSAAIPSTITTGTQRIAVCPSNFYFCSAYYRPGCCRIGRDCSLTNCPAAPSSSAFVSNGVTILVPVGASTGGSSYQTTALITGTASFLAYPTGPCAGGWTSCNQNVGGGCCPGGFTCGASCTATGAGATGVVSKLAPSKASAGATRWFGWGFCGFGVVAGFGMVFL